MLHGKESVGTSMGQRGCQQLTGAGEGGITQWLLVGIRSPSGMMRMFWNQTAWMVTQHHDVLRTPGTVYFINVFLKILFIC